MSAAFARSCRPGRLPPGSRACAGPRRRGVRRPGALARTPRPQHGTCRSAPRTTPCSRHPPRWRSIATCGVSGTRPESGSDELEGVAAPRPRAGSSGRRTSRARRAGDGRRSLCLGKAAHTVRRGKAEGLVPGVVPPAPNPSTRRPFETSSSVTAISATTPGSRKELQSTAGRARRATSRPRLR